MKEKDKNKTESAEMLHYISGETTGRERNAFERKIQKDEFAEDATEGLSELPGNQITTDLSRLDRRLKLRISRKNNIIFYRIAASVTVLLVLSSVFIVLNHKNQAEKQGEVTFQPATIEISKSGGLKAPEVTDQKEDKRTIAENVAGNAKTTVPEKVAEELTPVKEAEALREDKSGIPGKIVVTGSEAEAIRNICFRAENGYPFISCR